MILGKTVTTEFAYFSPGPTRNPADPARTPGGSSSGSAAAVADAMVPVAIGSQTAGSVIRPAAFCGTLGLKPTRGLVDLTGVMALSGNLDTLGWFAREAEDLALLGTVLADGWPDAGTPAPAAAAPPCSRSPARRGGSARTPTPSARSRARPSRLAAAGASVRDLDLPERFAALPEAQEALMAFDMARSLAHEYEHHADELSAVLRALLERGHTIDRAVAEDAVALGAECRALLAEHLEPGETLLVPAVSGEPPAFDDGDHRRPLLLPPVDASRRSRAVRAGRHRQPRRTGRRAARRPRPGRRRARRGRGVGRAAI